MKTKVVASESGSALVAVLSTVLIISLIGANVLSNSTTRYNSTANHVRAWKEALHAAEAGGDIAYAETRKAINGTPFGTGGWTVVAGTATPTWRLEPPAFGKDGSLTTTIEVDEFYRSIEGSPYYRIRATGTARLAGLSRVGMDSSMGTAGRGDNFLRQIDFFFDHFKATYGSGDATKNAVPDLAVNGKGSVAVARPQVTRRIELVATPVLPFEGAIKCNASFLGPGSAGRVDSYDSHNGAYAFIANTPVHPWYEDARNGNVAVNSPAFSQGGPIYGSVGTNGGTVTRSNTNISGTIDNNISFDLTPQKMPVPPSGNPFQPGTPMIINPTAAATNPLTPNWYSYSNLRNVIINPRVHTDGRPIETYVNIVVSGDVEDSITVNKGATVKIYFKGNLDTKARDLVNNNVDGAPGVLMQKWTSSGTAGALVASNNVSRAGHMQFYGVNDPVNAAQVIDIAPPGNIWATFYAPGAVLTMHGNPDVHGAIVCKTFDGNGNTGFHYDKALAGIVGDPVDFRVASYVEDVR